MRDRVVRVLLVIMALSSGFIGLWALLAPKSFYDDFPGAGRHWVSADGYPSIRPRRRPQPGADGRRRRGRHRART
jgi:hypothetical protein